MRIDWIIALVVFLVFAGWAFAYHSLFRAGEIVSLSESASQSGERIIEYMQARLSTEPASYTSAVSGTDVTLFAYLNITSAEVNSTRVVTQRLSNESLQCMVNDDDSTGMYKLYWNANVSPGENHYLIQHSDLDMPMNCVQSLPADEDKQATGWAAEPRKVFSTVKNAEVCTEMNDDYERTKNDIGTTYDFSVLIETDAGSAACGATVPRSGREVFVYPVTGALYEGGQMNMSVRLWL